MECLFNWCELWNGLLLGLLAALVFSILAIIFQKLIYYRIVYGGISGKFEGYGYKDKNETELGEHPISSAIIKHIGENLFSIKLQTYNDHEDFIWTGEMRMDTLKNGRIVWRYISPERLIHLIGVKDCIVSDDKKTIYLIGKDFDDEGKFKFGKEVLIRK